jgi:hypothetical protein
LNKHINPNSYQEILNSGGIESGKNITLQMKNGMMSRVTVNKTALTGKNTKGITCENGAVLPFVHNAKYTI